MVPYAEAQNKQAEECLGCPQMEWGTAGGGSRGKACKEKRKLMLMSGADLKDDPAKANLASMSLPVTSVKNWSKFVNDVALQFNRPLWGMAITIEVVPNAKSQFEVLFKPIGPLPDEYLPAVGRAASGCSAFRQEVLIPYGALAPPYYLKPALSPF